MILDWTSLSGELNSLIKSRGLILLVGGRGDETGTRGGSFVLLQKDRQKGVGVSKVDREHRERINLQQNEGPGEKQQYHRKRKENGPGR